MVKLENLETLPQNIKREYDWLSVLLFLYLHVFSIYAVYVLKDVYLLTIAFGAALILLGVLGTTAGAHRLWAHRTYVADVKLRIFLMLCQTLVGQGTIYNWVLQHRWHHKYFGTNLDPYNSSKGLFHIHLLSKATKPINGYDEMKTDIDMSDIESDCIVMFQKKYYWILYPIIVLLLPINAPAEYWGENLIVSAIIIGILRYCICLHFSWLAESAIQIWGNTSFNSTPNDSDLMDLIENNEWLSYHHLAPWDYQASEYGCYGNDFTSGFIRTCQVLGMASDLKTMDGQTVGKALEISAKTNKPISQCLLETHCLDVKNSKYNM